MNGPTNRLQRTPRLHLGSMAEVRGAGSLIRDVGCKNMTTAAKSLTKRLLLATALLLGAPLALWGVMAWAEASRHRARDDWFDIGVFGLAFPLAIVVVLVGVAVLLSCLLSRSVAACAARSWPLRMMQLAPFALAAVAACWSAVSGELLFYKIFGFFASGAISLFVVGAPVILAFIKITGKQEVTQQDAPPNGGPATRTGNAGVTEGPPSVS